MAWYQKNRVAVVMMIGSISELILCIKKKAYSVLLHDSER